MGGSLIEEPTAKANPDVRKDLLVSIWGEPGRPASRDSTKRVAWVSGDGGETRQPSNRRPGGQRFSGVSEEVTRLVDDERATSHARPAL